MYEPDKILYRTALHAQRADLSSIIAGTPDSPRLVVAPTTPERVAAFRRLMDRDRKRAERAGDWASSRLIKRLRDTLIDDSGPLDMEGERAVLARALEAEQQAQGDLAVVTMTP